MGRGAAGAGLVGGASGVGPPSGGSRALRRRPRVMAREGQGDTGVRDGKEEGHAVTRDRNVRGTRSIPGQADTGRDTHGEGDGVWALHFGVLWVQSSGSSPGNSGLSDGCFSGLPSVGKRCQRVVPQSLGVSHSSGSHVPCRWRRKLHGRCQGCLACGKGWVRMGRDRMGHLQVSPRTGDPSGTCPIHQLPGMLPSELEPPTVPEEGGQVCPLTHGAGPCPGSPLTPC